MDKDSSSKDNWLKYVAIVISLCAMLTTFWQMLEQRTHDRLSLQPRITAYYSTDGRPGKEMEGIYFYNGGQGNAVVHDMTVTVNGKVVKDRLFGDFNAALIAMKINPFCFIVRPPRKNDFLVHDEETAFIEVRDYQDAACTPARALLAEKERDQKAGLDFTIHFSSLYDEKFTYHYRSNTQTEGWD